jgi:mono/diheme cytochrome c family protein
LALTAALGAVIAARAEPGQAKARPPATTRTTMSGVYTAAQAARGEETYMSICVNCHPPGSYSGTTFKVSWGGRPLSDLFGQIKENMPKSDPASLSPREAAQLVAYILQLNDVPAGKTELPADPAVLRKIRLETPSMVRNKK